MLHEFSNKLIMNENSSSNDSEFEIVDGMKTKWWFWREKTLRARVTTG